MRLVFVATLLVRFPAHGLWSTKPRSHQARSPGKALEASLPGRIGAGRYDVTEQEPALQAEGNCHLLVSSTSDILAAVQ
jgi:hypothetical protein